MALPVPEDPARGDFPPERPLQGGKHPSDGERDHHGDQQEIHSNE
jgi:hypothetical protein